MRLFSSLFPALCCLLHATSAIAETAEQVIFNDIYNHPHHTKRVAIIGAGSAGSSAAYHLRKYFDQAGLDLNITVFERNDFVGGRSTTVGAYDDDQNPVELGASIFVNINHILANATKEFNLSTEGFGSRSANSGPELGIWNGRDFVFTLASGGGWWDNAKLLWKYGLAPIRTVRLMKSTVGKFMKMYEAPYFPWISLSDVVYELGLTAVTAATGEQYLKENSIGDLFANEIIQASTRVNYAQNLPLIHGLEAMVCMSTDGAMAVGGGNWQIFAHMLQASKANLHLNTQVTQLSKQEKGGYLVSYTSNPFSTTTTTTTTTTTSNASETYDQVILAAPYQYSNISFTPPPKHIPDEIPYVALHVTLFTSKHALAPRAFNLAPDQQVPQVVLTTLPPDEQQHHGSNTHGVGTPGFFSISTLRPTMDTRHGADRLEYLYKIFSHEAVNATFLSHILGLPPPLAHDEEVSAEDVSWVYRKLWHSYPYEYPRVTFEEVRLDEGLWYTSGIESFISTMETSALAGMNVAKLIATGWEHGG